jgi:hypothetical protein
MTEAADFPCLYQAAIGLNAKAVTLYQKKRYLLAHQTLKDAMLCMQLILRPDQYPVWPSKLDIHLKVTVAEERLRLVQEQASIVDEIDPEMQAEDDALSFVEPIPIAYERLDETGVDVNSAIIVFNFGLTYLGLGIRNSYKNKVVLYDAAVELFYLSYSILVKLSLETEQLDFCEYLLTLSMRMLRLTIEVDGFTGKDVSQLQHILRNAEESFSVLHDIGQTTIAAAA